MYKSVVLVMAMCLCAFTAFAQESLVALNGGQTVASGSLERPLVVASPRGHLVLLAVQNGNLVARASVDGATFVPYSVDLRGLATARIRDLRVYDRYCGEKLVFVHASDSDGDGLYALGFDALGNLGIQGGRLDDADSGSIARFEVHPDRGRAYYVVYQKNGALKARYVDKSDAYSAIVQLSANGAAVSDFSFQERMYNDRLTHYGASFAASGGASTLRYFEVSGGAVTATSTVGADAAAADFRYKLIRTDSGHTLAITQEHGVLYARRLEESTWKLLGGGVISVSQGAVTWFDLVELDGLVSVVYAAVKDGATSAYAAAIDATGNVTRHWDGAPLNRAPLVRTPTLTNLADGSAQCVFVESADGAQSVRVLSSGSFGPLWEDLLPFGLQAEEVLSCDIGIWDSGETCVLATLRSDGVTTVKALALPDSSQDMARSLISGTVTARGDDTWLLDSGTLVWRRAERCGAAKNAKAVSYNASVMQLETDTTQIMLAAQGGGTALVALPARRQPPKGAVRTFGDPLSMNADFCRLYVWDDKKPGTLTLEIQKRGYRVQGSWDGREIGNTSDTMRFFHFPAAETRHLELEVWSRTTRVASASVRLDAQAAATMKEELRSYEIRQPEQIMRDRRSLAEHRLAAIDGDAGLGRMFKDEAQGLAVQAVQVVEKKGFELWQLSESGKCGGPSLNNDGKVVWSEYNGYTYDIYLWDKNTIVKISDPAISVDNNQPLICDNEAIVWQGYVNNIRILFIYHNGIVRRLSTNSGKQHIALPDYAIGNTGTVVWCQDTSNSSSKTYFNVFYWDGINTNQITYDSGNRNPQICGNSIVWKRDGDLFFWNGVNTNKINQIKMYNINNVSVNSKGHVVRNLSI